jgi:hypothetical protein
MDAGVPTGSFTVGIACTSPPPWNRWHCLCEPPHASAPLFALSRAGRRCSCGPGRHRVILPK